MQTLSNVCVLLLFMASLFFSGCGQKSQSEENSFDNSISKSPTEHKNETAQIPAELAAQLEKMGYIKEKNTASKNTIDDPYKNADIAKHMSGIEGTFVMYDVEGDHWVRHNSKRASARFSPCSTFKIPNTLVGLETGVLSGPDAIIAWDKKKYPKEPWWDEVLKPMGLDWAKDHTLKSAFHDSVVWYYRELAIKIGEKSMIQFMKDFDYGNRDISSGIDGFWLSGSLSISANEQVAFLNKFLGGKLGLNPKTHKDAFEVFEVINHDEYALYAKTGSDGKHGDTPPVGWYVGFIVKDKKNYIFAFNMTGSMEEIRQKRVTISKSILTELKILPPKKK